MEDGLRGIVGRNQAEFNRYEQKCYVCTILGLVAASARIKVDLY